MKRDSKKTVQLKEEGTTAAAASLAPNSSPVDDPRSRTEMLSAIFGGLANVEVSELAKLHDQVLAINSKSLSSTIPDGTAEANKSTIEAKPSDAVSSAVREDVELMLAGDETLSEEFREKTATLFEAAVNARVATEIARIEEEAANDADAILEQVTASMVDKLDSYLTYVTEEWMKENSVAVESSLRSELTMEFIDGLKGLFAEHYIDIPEDKVDVVEALSNKVDSLVEQLDGLVVELGELQEENQSFVRDEIVRECAEGLSLSQAEKLLSLSEGVEFTDVEGFKKKVETLRESAFTRQTQTRSTSGTRELLEATEELEDNGTSTGYVDPNVKRYAQWISKNHSAQQA